MFLHCLRFSNWIPVFHLSKDEITKNAQVCLTCVHGTVQLYHTVIALCNLVSRKARSKPGYELFLSAPINNDDPLHDGLDFSGGGQFDILQKLQFLRVDTGLTSPYLLYCLHVVLPCFFQGNISSSVVNEVR